MSQPRLLNALKTHLVDHGIVRDPSGPGAAAPLWRQPDYDLWAALTPGAVPENGILTQAGDPVAAAFMSGGFPMARFESDWRRPIVEVRIRARRAPAAEDLGENILAAVIDRTDWMMGGRRVIESQMWRALTPVEIREPWFEYLLGISFELYAPQ